MQTIDVNLKNNSHTIFIGQNISSDLSCIIDSDKYDDIFLLTQQSIKNKYSHHALLNSGFKEVIIEDSEDEKNLKNIDKIIVHLLEKNCSRNSLIIGCGGGVTTDITGFIASIFMRGIDHVLIPTTLLSMVDASVGGKTGVNSNKGKNLIGTFKQPNSIIIDPTFLKTLDSTHMINGFAEIIKYGLIFNRNMYETVKTNFNDLINLQNLSELEKIIYNCCTYKKNIVVEDEFDNNKRMLLNFGHTIGHALESYYKYQNIEHGEAVYYGMIAASYISWKLDYLSKEDYNDIYSFINIIPKVKLHNINVEELKKQLIFDKKRIRNKNNFILLYNIGHATIKDNIPESIIDKSLQLLTN